MLDELDDALSISTTGGREYCCIYIYIYIYLYEKNFKKSTLGPQKCDFKFGLHIMGSGWPIIFHSSLHNFPVIFSGYLRYCFKFDLSYGDSWRRERY